MAGKERRRKIARWGSGGRAKGVTFERWKREVSEVKEKRARQVALPLLFSLPFSLFHPPLLFPLGVSRSFYYNIFPRGILYRLSTRRPIPTLLVILFPLFSFYLFHPLPPISLSLSLPRYFSRSNVEGNQFSRRTIPLLGGSGDQIFLSPRRNFRFRQT